MKHYVLITVKDGDEWEDEYFCDEQTAVAEAKYQWQHLSAFEKRHYTTFELCEIDDMRPLDEYEWDEWITDHIARTVIDFIREEQK